MVVSTVQDELELVVPAGGRCAPRWLLPMLRPARTPDELLLDLRGMGWVEPGGLVALAAMAEAEASRGRCVRLIAPHEPRTATYLSRMRLGQVIESLGGEHDLRPVQERDVADALLETTRFAGERGVEALASVVYNNLVAQDEEAAGAMHTGIVEIGSNVPQHSGRAFGYVAAQVTHRSQQGLLIQFAVADCGQGVLASLRSVGATTDAHALELALDRGVSRTGQAGRGVGIGATRDLAIGLGGGVCLVSGSAWRSATGQGVRCGSGQLAFSGTLLQAEVVLSKDG